MAKTKNKYTTPILEKRLNFLIIMSTEYDPNGSSSYDETIKQFAYTKINTHLSSYS